MNLAAQPLKIRTPLDAFAVVVFMVAVGLLIANILAGCAGWGATTCTVVDLAHDACGVIRYLDENGKPVEMKVTNEDMKAVAKARAFQDAGTK